MWILKPHRDCVPLFIVALRSEDGSAQIGNSSGSNP
jgi:hypothetical protein